MAYADELEKEGVASQYLVILVPRRMLDSASYVSGGAGLVYQSFTLGQINRLELDGTARDEAANTADIGVGGDWYYDVDLQRIYIDSTLSPSASFAVVYYEIYVSTFDAYWYRDPLNASTRTVYYEPLVSSSPSINQSATEDLFGFLPSLSSSITLSNATVFFTEHVYESSFNLAEVKIYHYLNTLTIANTKLVFDGFSKNIAYSDRAVRLELFDNSSLFEKEFRHVSGKNFYGSSFLAGLDPDFEGSPIRKIFGRVDRLIPVNIDFNADAPSGTNNRDYIVMNPDDNLVSVTLTVPSSPVSTTTRTYVTGPVFTINVGDNVWIDKTIDEYVTVTAVTASYIDHETLVSGAATTGDTVKRGFIGNVFISRNDFPALQLKYIRDYTILTDATNKLSGFTLVDNFENNYNGVGQMFENTGTNNTTLTTSDLVFCRAYGPTPTSDDTIDGVIFGSSGFTLDNSLHVSYSILKRFIGIEEAKIDTDAFEDLFASARGSATIGLSIPKQRRADFPSYKEILIDIFQSVLLKFYINNNSLYSITLTEPLGTISKTIEDDEIIRDSFAYEFDYKDIVSDVFVNYDRKEVSNTYTELISFNTVSAASNETALYLHKNPKQKTFETILSLQADAQTLADRLGFALGERRGLVRFTTKNRFFGTDINEAIRITRDRMPGFEYVGGSDRNRDGAVVSAEKTLTSVNITLDDQKGIEDNSGSW